jgi:hypothetical protein
VIDGDSQSLWVSEPKIDSLKNGDKAYLKDEMEITFKKTTISSVIILWKFRPKKFKV